MATEVTDAMAVGAGLLKLDLGDSLAGLVAVSIALGLTVASFGLLLGVITRTGRQADMVGTLVAFVLPFISGIFPMGGFEPAYMAGGVIGTIGAFFALASRRLRFD